MNEKFETMAKLINGQPIEHIVATSKHKKTIGFWTQYGNFALTENDEVIDMDDLFNGRQRA